MYYVTLSLVIAKNLYIVENEDIANRAVSEVVVTYSDQKPPLLSIDDAIKARKVYPLPPPLDKFAKGDAQSTICVVEYVEQYSLGLRLLETFRSVL